MAVGLHLIDELDRCVGWRAIDLIYRQIAARKLRAPSIVRYVLCCLWKCPRAPPGIIRNRIQVAVVRPSGVPDVAVITAVQDRLAEPFEAGKRLTWWIRSVGHLARKWSHGLW